MEASEFAHRSGIATCLEFNPEMLVPEERIRSLCRENKCGSFQTNYMCPPYIGTLEEIKKELGKFRTGLLLQYSKNIDVKHDKAGVIRTKLDFHKKVLLLEDYLKEKNIKQLWGMIGGNCGLCDVCKACNKEPCLFPDKARTSLEAIAVNVTGLLDKLGLDNAFYDDRITWTGCVLFNNTQSANLD